MHISCWLMIIVIIIAILILLFFARHVDISGWQVPWKMKLIYSYVIYITSFRLLSCYTISDASTVVV